MISTVFTGQTVYIYIYIYIYISIHTYTCINHVWDGGAAHETIILWMLSAAHAAVFPDKIILPQGSPFLLPWFPPVSHNCFPNHFVHRETRILLAMAEHDLQGQSVFKLEILSPHRIASPFRSENGTKGLLERITVPIR